MNTFELSLDLDKSVGAKQWITLRQGDKRGTTLQATLYDHGVLVSGSYTCRVSIRHPNRNTYYRETATYSNGVATVTIDETSAASVVGVTEGYFELLQGSTLIASTESFGVRVLQSATDGATVGPPYDSAIEDALAELDAATGRISQMVVDATAEYLAAHPEITTTVQDNSVTDAKLIQSGGVLDRVGRLWWRLENLLTNTLAEAESVTVSDAAKTPVAGLTVFGKSTQDGTPTPDSPVPISSVTENLYDYSDATVRVNAGVTWTPQADGTIKAAGTATGTSFGLGTPSDADKGKSFFFHVQKGVTYTATSFGDVDFNVYRRKLDGTAETYMAYSKDDKTFTMDEECWVQLGPRVSNGTVTNTTYRIALVEGTKAASAYVPRGNIGLWTHRKNLAKPYMTNTYTYNNITWMYAGDGMWSANGTTGSATSSNQWQTYRLGILPAGDYTVTMTPLSGTITGAGLAIAYRTGAGAQTAGRILGVSSGGRVTCTLTADGTSFYWLQPYIRENTTVTNLVLGMQVEVGSATAYVPYAESVTALPLDGHTLRSLPDGTRDEVTVDQYGHVILTQRVGETTFDGSSDETWTENTVASTNVTRYRVKMPLTMPDFTGKPAGAIFGNLLCDHFEEVADARDGGGVYNGEVGCAVRRTNASEVWFYHANESLADFKTWLASNPTTVLYPLATPITHDLGTIDPTALVGPDMTAQAVPTAPFALTYERDLNTTLARLEAAIAALA